MGSRPSSVHAGTNGTMTSQSEAALRSENTELKVKLSALEELNPTQIKEENEELRRLNKELREEIKSLRMSTSRRSSPGSTDNPNKSSNTTSKDKDRRSKRRINSSSLAPQRLSDIDAYGQGIPLEKHPPIRISKNNRKRSKKTGGDGKPIEISMAMDKEAKDQEQAIEKASSHQNVAVNSGKDADKRTDEQKDGGVDKTLDDHDLLC